MKHPLPTSKFSGGSAQFSSFCPGMQLIVVRHKLSVVTDLPRFEAHRGHRFSGTADDSLTTPRSRDISSDHAMV